MAYILGTKPPIFLFMHTNHANGGEIDLTPLFVRIPGWRRPAFRFDPAHHSGMMPRGGPGREGHSLIQLLAANWFVGIVGS